MGIAGTEVAKEASDIILMDDNFASIVKAIMWGRCVNDAVRKFLQFQISTNVTAVVITFVSAVASNEEVAVLTAVQLLWINIIMDTFAALALATDPASESLLDRKPDTHGTRLFTADMIKMILGQSIYQIAIILVFHFLGHGILGLDHSERNNGVVTTLVFNTFVFAQIFNSINCRRLDNKLNIFEGILRNRFFLAITAIGTSILCVPKRSDVDDHPQRSVDKSSSFSSVVPPSRLPGFPLESGVSHWRLASFPSHSVLSSDASRLLRSSALSSN